MAHRTHFNIAAHTGPITGRFEVDIDPKVRAKEAAARDMFARYAERARTLQSLPVKDADSAIAAWLNRTTIK